MLYKFNTFPFFILGKSIAVVLSPEETVKMSEIAIKENNADLDYWANVLSILTVEQR